MAILKAKYVCTDAINNNNKFWEYEFDDVNETVTVKYGRVGKTCQVDGPKSMSRRELDRIIGEKTRARGKEGSATYKPPYKEITVVADSMPTGPSGPATSKVVVHAAATSQLAKSNPLLTALVTRLVESNKHELFKASGGQMDIDLTTGIISTPVGVITKSSILEARTVLDDLSKYVTKKDFDDKNFIVGLNNYLMLVPQTVGHSRGWHRYFMTDNAALQRQNTLLDQLDASSDLAASRILAAATGAAATSIAATPNLFDAELDIVTDKADIDRMTKLYMDNVNSAHETRNMRPVRFYSVRIPKADLAFQNDGAKLTNVWQLWHGTRMFNVLSILKNSLFCPPKGGTFAVTGRMFGDGVYASDQSTKALNYAYGYWDGGARDKSCFMFLVDMAMGNYHVPKSSYESLPHKGSDSTFAKGRESGVMNNEMIVYRNSQVNPRYLIEFEEKR